MSEETGVVTWTATRLQLVEAIRQVPPGLSDVILADAILARLPELAPGSVADLAFALAAAEHLIAERDAELAGLRDPRNVSVRREDLRAVISEGLVSEVAMGRLMAAVEAAP